MPTPTLLTVDLQRGESAAIARWQGMDRFYERVQDIAAGNTADDDVAREVHDHLIALAYRHPPLTSTLVAWRGIRSAEAAYGMSVNALMVQLTHGEEFDRRLERFTSASLAQEIALRDFTRPALEGGAVLLRLVLHPGVQVLPIYAYAATDSPQQSEILLPPHLSRSRLTSLKIEPVQSMGQRLAVGVMEVFP